MGLMISSAVKRMNSKFDATGCLDNRPRSDRPSTSANAAWAVQKNIEIAADSSTHGEVSTREVACRTGILYTTVSVALWRSLQCYPYKMQLHHQRLSTDFVKRRAFAEWAFKKMANDDNWLSNVLSTDEDHFTLRGFVN